MRHQLRQYIEPRTDTLLEEINEQLLSSAIDELKQRGKKGLVVIVDNLDRIDNIPRAGSTQLQPQYLFIERGEQLKRLNCHVIYTIPLMLTFSNELNRLRNRFGVEPKVLPMVQVQLRNGDKCEQGIELLKQMVLAKAFPKETPQQRLNLIEEVFDNSNTLEHLCQISGGHLRNLLVMLFSCLQKTDPPISDYYLTDVIRRQKDTQIRAITDDELILLRQVLQEKQVKGVEEYQTLVRSMFVFEYQDKQGVWFGINPLFVEVPILAKVQKEQKAFTKKLEQVEQFLKQADAVTHQQDNVLQVISVPSRLKSHVPLPVIFIEQPVDQDVIELQRQAKQLSQNRQTLAGLLLYQKQPHPIFFTRMYEVRLRDHFFLIPIPFAEVEQALDKGEAASTGVLDKYASRYLTGANLFDDRNAISDILTFYGRDNLQLSLEEDLRRCQGIGLFGIRKSGKTSVLLQLGFSMLQHPVVSIDFQIYDKMRYGAELFNKILQELSHLLIQKTTATIPSFERFQEERPARDLASDFTQEVCKLAYALEKAGYKLPIICLLDEVERIFPQDADPKERVEEFNSFFGALRELSQIQKRLSFIVADVHPDCNRINYWHQSDVPTNPVFNFFKEVFLPPFSQEETTKMLMAIGQLMGVKFNQELLTTIHRDSGGHPFIARQLASLIYKELNKEKKLDHNKPITFSTAQRYLNRPFKYSDILKNYFKESIWVDLEKRNFAPAMAILRLLACNEELEEGVGEEALLDRLSDEFTESECESALLWLASVGLIVREELEEGDSYRLHIRLLSRWLRRNMRKEEILQWQIHSVTFD